MKNPFLTLFSALGRMFSKIKLKCHSSCCEFNCDSISAEEYRDIMIAAYQLAAQNNGRLPRYREVTMI